MGRPGSQVRVLDHVRVLPVTRGRGRLERSAFGSLGAGRAVRLALTAAGHALR